MCLVCGALPEEIYIKRVKASYHLCPACQFMEKDSAYHISDQEAFARYETHRNSPEDEAYRAYFRRFVDHAIIPYLPAALTKREPTESSTPVGLDFGSGPAPVLAGLMAEEYTLPMDIYDYFYAPEKSYQNKKYYLITCTEVIEHLADPHQYFALFASLLAPRGILAIMTNFHTNNPTRFEDWHYLRDSTHITFHTPQTMSFLAEKHNMQVLFSDGRSYTTLKLL